MFSIQQIANVWVHFFNESLQNILSQDVSLVQLSQKLEQLVNQTGGEVLKAILEQADEAIYAAIKPEHHYQVKAHRSRTLMILCGGTFTHIANSGNLEAYARKQFTAHRQTMKPEVNQEILKKEWSR